MEVENWGKMHGFDHPFSLEGVVQKYVFCKVLLPFLTLGICRMCFLYPSLRFRMGLNSTPYCQLKYMLWYAQNAI